MGMMKPEISGFCSNPAAEQSQGLLLQRRRVFGCVTLEVMGVLPKLQGSNDKVAFKDMSKFSNERTNDKNEKEQRNSRSFCGYK